MWDLKGSHFPTWAKLNPNEFTAWFYLVIFLRSGLKIPVLLWLLHKTSAYNYSVCEENSLFLTPLWTSPVGAYYIRVTPGGGTWCDADKICLTDLCTADAAASISRDTLTHYYKIIFNLPNPGYLETSCTSSARRNLKSYREPTHQLPVNKNGLRWPCKSEMWHTSNFKCGFYEGNGSYAKRWIWHIVSLLLFKRHLR